MAQVIDSDVNAFRASFTGTVIAPGHAGYDEARSIWNGNIDRQPGLIARCSSAAEVAAAIRFARAQDLEISVRGGGHGMAGLAVTEGGLMIDLSPMNEVRVDPAARRAVAGGGASLGALDAATQAHGLAVPAGVVSHTGVAGLTLGGALIVVGYGSPEHHQRAVQPLREAHPPLFEVVTPIPYTQLQQLLDEGNPWGIQAYEKGLHVDELTDEVIDVFIEPCRRSGRRCQWSQPTG